MQTLDEYMNSLTMKEHAKFVRDVPISSQALYAVRRGSMKLSISTALDLHDMTQGKVDPRPLTKGDVWGRLEAFFKAHKGRRRA